jgi:hypothetical protein
MSRRVFGIRLSAAIAILAFAWMLVLVIAGGFDTFLFGVRVRSNDPAKPRQLAELAFLVFAWLRGLRRTKADLERIGNRILAVWPRVRTPAMWALAGGVFVLGVLKLGPYAGGSDSYGYVSQVDLWLNGHPFIDQPWMDKAPWPKSGFTFTPLGYMEDPSRHAIVPTYSPGLPFLMALIHLVAGYRAMFLVLPLSAAILVLATHGLGHRLGSPNVGAIGAWLVATSPAVLSYMIQPLTDVPAAAAWALAFYLVFGRSLRSAVGAGVTAGIAMLIRPNLVLSAAVMGTWLLFKIWRDVPRRSLHVWRTAGFLVGFLPCVAVLAGVYTWLYGSPVQSGYGSLGQYYDASHILPNLRSYLSWLAETETPLAYLGFVGLVFAVRRFWPDVPDRSMIVALAVFVATLWGQYAAFQFLNSWVYLRYVLGSWPALMLGVAAVLLFALRRAGKPGFAVATVGVIALGFWTFDFAIRSGGLDARRGEIKYAAAGQLVRAYSEDGSVVLAGQHSGSVRYYGGRVTLRSDGLDREWLDRAVEWLGERGIHAYALLEESEVDRFMSDFAGQTRAQLRRRLVFEYQSTARVYFFDLSRPVQELRKPEKVIETYTGPVFFPPAPSPKLELR